MRSLSRPVPWWMWLFLVVVLAAGVRIYHLGELSFVADEFLDVNSSYGYARTGDWQAWNFNTGSPDIGNVNVPRDERAAIYKWQVAQVFRHVAPTETTARSVSVLWGLITTMLIYFSATYFSRRRTVGLIAAFLYAVSVSGLEIDRRVRMYAMFVPVFLALWWMVFRLFEEPYVGRIGIFRSVWKRFGFNPAYLVPASLLFALALSLHLLAVNIFAIVLVYAAVMAVRRWRKDGERWNKYLSVWAVAIVGCLGVRILFPAEYGLISASLGFPDNHYGYFGIVFEDYAHRLLALCVFGLGIHRFLVTGHGRNPDEDASGRTSGESRGWWIVVSFLTILFLAVFVWKRNVGAQYIAFAEPFKAIVMSGGIFAVATFVREHVRGATRKAQVAALIAGIVFLPNYGYFLLENNAYRQTSRGTRPDYRSVFGYVVKHGSSGEALVTRGFRNYYWSGARFSTYDFGGELVRTGQAEKLSLPKLQAIMGAHSSGWVVLSENDEDYVTKEARDYIARNMDRLNVIAVRGPIGVYRWGVSDSDASGPLSGYPDDVGLDGNAGDME